MFANRAVTLYHEVEWPPRSLDLTAYLKSQVFVTPPRGMQDLRNRIQVEFEILRQNPRVIRNAVRSTEERTQVCIEKYDRHIE